MQRPALYFSLLSLMLVTACSSGPPRNITDGCEIFSDMSGWYRDANRAYEKWGVPVHVQLAIIYQESRFVEDARPPRDRLLWVIPWGRISSAYGYAQAQDSTWDWYLASTGRRWADRDDFDDVVDFIGWYGSISHRKLGISKWDAYSQYLAYHEGHGGFNRRSFKNKQWLKDVSRKVSRQSSRYTTQLRGCEEDLKDDGWWFW